MWRLKREVSVNKACVRALVRNIWKRVSYFWWLDERSCNGVWSPNREFSLLLGKRGTGRRGNRGAWTSSYSAAPLWLTVGLNMMSGTVRITSATYRISGLRSADSQAPCVCANARKKDYLLMIFFFFSWTSWSRRSAFNHPAAENQISCQVSEERLNLPQLITGC